MTEMSEKAERKIEHVDQNLKLEGQEKKSIPGHCYRLSSGGGKYAKVTKLGVTWNKVVVE